MVYSVLRTNTQSNDRVKTEIVCVQTYNFVGRTYTSAQNRRRRAFANFKCVHERVYRNDEKRKGHK